MADTPDRLDDDPGGLMACNPAWLEKFDLDSLRAVMAQRTPGEWAVDEYNGEIHDGNGFRIAILARRDDCAAIVAAVNALGPLLERVRELERKG